MPHDVEIIAGKEKVILFAARKVTFMLTFYHEWLCLPKADFRILMVLARDGGFKGNLSDLCRRYGLTLQKSNRDSFIDSIEALTQAKFITSQKSGRTYTLSVTPQKTEIKICEQWFDAIVKAEKYSKSVSKEVVLKTILWLNDRGETLFTNAEAEKDLAIHEDAFKSAKEVLIKDFGVLSIKYKYVEAPDGKFHIIGQIARLSAYMNI